MGFEDATTLARQHEELLFRRAYPASPEQARQMDRELLEFPLRLARSGVDPAELETARTSGIAGTRVTAVFSYGVALHLNRAHAESVSIAWDAYESAEPLGRLLPLVAPLASEEALVEANVPYAEWLRALARGRDELDWLLNALRKAFPALAERAAQYDALQLPLRWELGGSTASRTLMRLPVKPVFCHDGPLLTRKDVSLDSIPDLEPLPVRRLPSKCGELVLKLARDTSAVRFRELHGFTWGDPRHVYEIDAGRGVRFCFSGVAPEHRLPLRAYHALSLWKNGVPAGYFEGLSLFERMEAGFNLYYTFRGGETAWMYSQILRAMRQMLGVSCFVVDPFQIGHENDEAIESGAFWFYRKLGFRSVSPDIRELTAREERRLARKPGARTQPALLRRLVAEPMSYAFPGGRQTDWDGFRLRRLLLGGGLSLPKQLREAKQGAEEAQFLRLMQRDEKLRARCLAGGSTGLPAASVRCDGTG